MATTATLKCRHGHVFPTSARPGGTTGCPVCRRGGRRTSVRVPVTAPPGKQGAPGQQHQGDSDPEAARLAAAWGAEAPAEYAWRAMPTEPAPYECDECGAPMAWHSAHTTLVCTACPTSITSPGAEDRAGAHAEALARRAARNRGELAVIDRDPEAEARARAARVNAHQQRETLRRYAAQMLAPCEADAHDRIQWRRLGFDLGSRIRGYLPEITAAPDSAALLEIAQELRAIRDSENWQDLAAEARAAAERREHAEYAAELAERQEREAIEAERAAEAERRAAERAAQQQQRRQIAAAPSANTVAIAQLGKMVYDWQQSKAAAAAAIERHGACGWCRKPAAATRIYAFANYGYYGGTAEPDISRTHARACAKHHGDADTWMKQQASGATYYYWDLT